MATRGKSKHEDASGMETSNTKKAALSIMRSRTRKAKKLIFSYGTILFMIFSAFSITSLYLMRENILSNSNAVGHEVAQRLDTSLQLEFDKQKQFVEFIAHYAEVFLQDHRNDPDGGRAAFDFWLKQTEELLRDNQSDIRMDIYASIDGKIVSPTYWDGDEFLVTEARPWYRAAMAAGENTAVILDPYTDVFTNTVITTVAARIGNSRDVIAIDLYLESSSQASTFASLVPENYCFYLVDGKGAVILYYTPFNATYSQVQQYINSFFESHIKNYTVSDIEGTPITDLIGEKRRVFTTYNPKTGWYTVATTLYSDILFNYHMISNLFLLMVVIFIIIEVWMVWREYHLSSQIETTNEALKVLGNSYQIIMRVNFKQGTFTTLKAPDIMRLRLASRNSFDDLISVFSDVVLPDSWNNFYKNFSLSHLRNLASLSIRDFGHDYQLKLNNDNRYRWFNARILFDESLDLDESIICFKLIDEEKITEIEEHKLLADALESAKKNEESKNVFFANMSHDMRTPLNGIIGLCQIGLSNLKRQDTTAMVDVFKKMTTASHQLLTLVDDILEVARPQMENKLNLVAFNIVHEVTENIDVFKVNAAQQGKKVNLFFDVNHQVVIGDTAKLRQILNNLVSNSLKYSHPGCVVNIHISEVLHLHKPSFMIEVADTGIGMDREFLTRLFNPYAREQRLTSVQGTGLGMSIVKNVVNIMGGDIKVKSTVNVGTTFTINIPLRLADEATAEQVNRELQGGLDIVDAAINQANAASGEEALKGGVYNKTANKPTSLPKNYSNVPAIEISPEVRSYLENLSLEGLHILIVEDNQLNMEIACDILSMKGVKLTCTWDGLEAVETFTKMPAHTFDAILMDMRMPKMDGCEASAAIRASDKADAKTIPIIACTANAFTEDIAATQNAGMNAHVSKPLDFNVLERVLSKIIASRMDLPEHIKIIKSLNQEAAPAAADANNLPSVGGANNELNTADAISVTVNTPDGTAMSPKDAIAAAAQNLTNAVKAAKAAEEAQAAASDAPATTAAAGSPATSTSAPFDQTASAAPTVSATAETAQSDEGTLNVDNTGNVANTGNASNAAQGTEISQEEALGRSSDAGSDTSFTSGAKTSTAFGDAALASYSVRSDNNVVNVASLPESAVKSDFVNTDKMQAQALSTLASKLHANSALANTTLGTTELTLAETGSSHNPAQNFDTGAAEVISGVYTDNLSGASTLSMNTGTSNKVSGLKPLNPTTNTAEVAAQTQAAAAAADAAAANMMDDVISKEEAKAYVTGQSDRDFNDVKDGIASSNMNDFKARRKLLQSLDDFDDISAIRVNSARPQSHHGFNRRPDPSRIRSDLSRLKDKDDTKS